MQHAPRDELHAFQSLVVAKLSALKNSPVCFGQPCIRYVLRSWKSTRQPLNQLTSFAVCLCI